MFFLNLLWDLVAWFQSDFVFYIHMHVSHVSLGQHVSTHPLHYIKLHVPLHSSHYMSYYIHHTTCSTTNITLHVQVHTSYYMCNYIHHSTSHRHCIHHTDIALHVISLHYSIAQIPLEILQCWSSTTCTLQQPRCVYHLQD